MSASILTDRLAKLLAVAFFSAIVIAGLFHLGGKMIEVRPPARPVITGYGEGKVVAKPDTAELTLGVQTGRQPTAEQAMKVLTDRMDAVLKQVKAQGIEDKDVHTTGISLFPAYDWIDGRQEAKGFEASENVVMTVRDIARVGQTVTAATKSGANQVLGVRFYLQDVTQLRREARAMAIAKAEEDAAELARNMDVRIGALSAVQEQSSGVPGPQFFKAQGMGGGEGGGVPMPSGEGEFVVGVALTYELR